MNPTFRAGYSPRAAYSFSPVHDSEPDRPVAYVCTVCGRSFPFLSSLSQHMRRHTGCRPYKCPYCPHRASQKGNLKVHIRSHKLSMLISSGLQREELGNNGSVELGVKESLEVKTTPTKSISPCKGEMNGKTFWRTLKREKRGVTQWLYCRLCGHEAQREDQLLSHIEKVHITIDPEQCESLPEAGGEVGESIFTCELCRQSFSQALLLQVHRRKHCAPLHSCSVCDRTFSQVWFLKSHMRTHSRGRALARGRSTTQSQLLTINVSQDPKPSGSTGLYELCSECGHIFHSSESLKVHIQVHTLSRTGQQQCGDQTLSEDNQQSPATKRCFMEYLCLRPVGYIGNGDDERSRLGCRVRQMNPVCSAQAWQLATRGHLLTSVKGTEASASAETLDQGRPCLLIAKGAERRQARRRSLGGSGSCTAECPELQSDTEYLPCYRTARRSPNIKPRECFECGKVFRNRSRLSVHIRTHHRDSRSSGGEADPGSPSPFNTCSTQPLGERGDNSRAAKSTQAATDEKMYIGSQCDYITTASSDFLSHVHCVHPCSVAVLGNGCPSLSPHASVDTTSSLSRMKNEFLHKPVSGLQVHPSSTAQPQSQMQTACDAHSPAPAQAVHDSDPESRRRPQSQTRVQEEALDLCIRLDGTRDSLTPSAVQEALPCHQCCYCNYSTRWLEVLWMHQNIAHRISSNTVAPSWAPIKTSRCTKEGLLLGRRTGAPPALDGKECPPLAMVTRSQRTCPPTVTQNSTVHWSVSMSSEKAGQANPGEPHGSRTQVGEKRDQGVMRVCIESRAQLGSTGLSSAKVLGKSPIIQAAGFNIESIKTCKEGFSKNSSYIQSTNAPNYTADNGYRVSWPQEGTMGVSRSSQKQGPKMPDPMDVLSFLKQCNSCDPAVPYRSWSTSKLQPPNRVGDGCQQKGYMRQGFGKEFRQSSHPCIHVRSHRTNIRSSHPCIHVRSHMSNI